MHRCYRLAVALLCCAVAAGSIEQLERELEALLAEGAARLNTSFSVAVLDFRSGRLAGAARGVDDRATGQPIGPGSLFPVGSVTKTFVTVSALRLAERGELDLDAPVLPVIEPWLKSHGLPSLVALWGREAGRLSKVTGRELLSMRSGLADYEDLTMQRWTEQHPGRDFGPFDYLRNCSKEFLFEPGQGGAYSSNGYVVAGLLLAALTNSSGWEQLDLAELAGLGRIEPPLAHTLFMGPGRCSQHPGVVHQYGIDPSAQPPRQVGAPWEKQRTASQQCGRSKSGVQLVGTKAQRWTTSTGEQCCQLAQQWAGLYKLPVMWQWLGQQCTVFDHVWKMQPHPGSLVGQIAPLLDPTDVYDLYNESCLNGWVMGNLAVSPEDVVRFYHALFTGGLLRPESVASMMDWQNMSMGWGGSGMQYGMGLLLFPNFEQDATGQQTNATFVVGHPGADWGSSMMTVGWYPNLNLSLALASNSIVPLNFTAGVHPMGWGSGMTPLACRVQDAAVRFALPGNPGLRCPDYDE